MPFQVNVDILGEPRPDGAATRIEQGNSVLIHGWALDPAAKLTPVAIYGVVDGTFRLRASVVARADVAKHFGLGQLVNCGFDLSFSTQFLPLGVHGITLQLEDAAGRLHDTGIRGKIEVLPARPLPPASPRVLIAAAPKSGSTYTWSVLKKYFGTTDPPLHGIYQDWEHNIDAWVLERIRGRSYILQMHMRPYLANVAAIQSEQMATIVTWRNLADTLVSLDDHISKERDNEPAMTFFGHVKLHEYLAMSDQQRYAFLVRHIAPWYISFRQGWKDQSFPLHFAHYEQLAADPQRYFTEIINHIAGKTDRDRLSAIVGAEMAVQESRKNVGITGRSIDRFPDDVKTLLEDLLRTHYDNLDDLVAELPWNARRAVSV